ncbi:MAG: DUF488 domain-containing protein [Nitrospirae bacterium]|nr:DUF488 domain-containing protein [Nitrospirota bacterium]
MLKVKRIYETASSEDGKRILVDRLWPRGIKKEKAEVGEWLKEIAPSDELRKWFAHDPSKWQAFKTKYAHEIGGKSDLLQRLRKESGKATVTLVYSAKDNEHNNAVALKEIIEQL